MMQILRLELNRCSIYKLMYGYKHIIVTNVHINTYLTRKCSQNIANNSDSMRLMRNKLERSVTSDLLNELSEDMSVCVHRNPNPFDTRIDNQFIEQIGATLPKSYNVAAFVNKSYALQQLVKLGVNLYEIENKTEDVIEFMIKLDFDNDIAPYIQFLHDNGVSADQLGRYITKNPIIFKQSMENLQQRIDYLRSKKFNKSMIASIITIAPKWLSFPIQSIDAHLGFLQKEYGLSGDQIRQIVVASPRVALMRDMHLRETSFMLKEEMGFTSDEIKKIILSSPYLFKKGHKNAHKVFIQIFDFVHNEMNISHKLISEFPLILTLRLIHLKPRHYYLKLLKRDQYNPELPLYVPLSAFIHLDDTEFCEKYARTSIGDYNDFLKTL